MTTAFVHVAPLLPSLARPALAPPRPARGSIPKACAPPAVSNPVAPPSPLAAGLSIVPVPHISDFLPDLAEIPHPPTNKNRKFYTECDAVLADVTVKSTMPDAGVRKAYIRAGPREKIVFQSEKVRAAIVTCGGLCPGLNVVIREITECLMKEYGVSTVFGVQHGYRGFYNGVAWRALDLDTVDQVHKTGGTFLGTSRGGFDGEKIVDAIEARNINMVFVIGGDGTIRGADKIAEECAKRKLQVSIAAVPKTIDNDIPIIDRSFGFDTAIEEGLRAVNAGSVEVNAALNGVGIVKIMGRDAGFIAMHTTLSSRDVDICLIPEVKFDLKRLAEFIRSRLDSRGKCLVVVAEGAGEEAMKADFLAKENGTDASGNKLRNDIGLWLQDNLKSLLRSDGSDVSFKYIDPTYMVRAVPSCAADNIYCTFLAHNAVHGAFAGYTGFVTGTVNGKHVLLPMKEVVSTSRRVVVGDSFWTRLVSSTGQPSFSD